MSVCSCIGDLSLGQTGSCCDPAVTGRLLQLHTRLSAASCCRAYSEKRSILEQTLQERVILAKQLEDLIRITDQITTGLAGLGAQPDEEFDSAPED